MNNKRFMLSTLSVLTITVVVHAQPPSGGYGGYRPPNSSPAFGWLGQGSATQRYLTNVRPQQEAQATFQNIQQQIDATARAALTARENQSSEAIRPTGARAATFMNLGHYYPPRTGPTGRMGGGRP